MTRIEKAFANGKALIVHLMGGDPDLEKTEDYLRLLLKAGADMVMIGIPFSDPAGESRLVQEANVRALATGTNVDGLFSLVRRIREESEKALLFRSYLNPLFRYGYENFFKEARLSGLDGIVIPDLPFEEKEELLQQAQDKGIVLISQTAPTTSHRLEPIVREAQAFVYQLIPEGDQTDAGLIARTRKATSLPILVGCAGKNLDQIKLFASEADGVIIEDALVELIGCYADRADRQILQLTSATKALIKG